MNRLAVAGAALAVVGIVGYAIGIRVAYPGRAFSVTAVMVGIALLSIGRAQGARSRAR